MKNVSWKNERKRGRDRWWKDQKRGIKRWRRYINENNRRKEKSGKNAIRLSGRGEKENRKTTPRKW